MMTRREAIATGVALSLSGVGAEAADAPATPLLGPVRAVLTTATDLDKVQAAYSQWLGYKVVERGVVSPEVAAFWGAPKVAGKGYLAMRPEAGEPTLLRFVEQAQPAGFVPMTTLGWNSTEIIVQDCDRLAEHLKDSPFRIVGPPRPLSGMSEIHAMQVVGPANEMLYLTAVTSPLPASRDMPTAEAFVGRCFITVVGGPGVPAMSAYYGDTFGNTTGQIFHTRIQSLSKQRGAPPETEYDLAVVQLGGGTKIELDGYPAGTPARPRPAGGMPTGMSMVSFECKAFDRYVGRMVAPPKAAASGSFKGRRTGVLVGNSGELIELIET